MKNFKTVSILLLLVFAFASCEKDDSTPEPSNEDLVIGLWQLQSATQDGNPITLGACANLTTIRFTDSGAFTQTFYSGNNCSMVTPQSGTFSISGDMITVNTGSAATITRIVTLNDSNLSLEFNESGVLLINNYIKQ